MPKKHKQHPYCPPEPPGEYALGGFVPGYTEHICPGCSTAYCGGKGSTECKRCALDREELKRSKAAGERR